MKICLSSILIITIVLGCLFATIVMAHDDHGYTKNFERDDHDCDDEGSEFAGQMAAWLLLVANFPVALSLLIKGTNRFGSLRAEIKKTLEDLNRTQQKVLMWLHYYLNPAMLIIAIWHWLTSRCESSALPELGLIVMAAVVVLGILIKFKLSPKGFRKHIYLIHTQPLIFLAIFLVLTAGHLIMD